MKKIFGTLVLSLVLVLAACGGSDAPVEDSIERELEAAAEAIDLFEGVLTDNVTLPTSDGDISIAWTSSNEDFLSVEGIIARPAYGKSDTGAQMTAVFSKEGVSYTAYYNATIAAQGEESLIALMDEAVANLPFNGARFTEKVALDDKVGDIALTYVSNDPDVLTDDGAVFKALASEEDKAVSFTVTATLEGVEKTYDVPLTIGTFDPLSIVSSSEVSFRNIEGEYSVSDGALMVHTMSNSLPYVDIEDFVALISGAVVYSELDFVYDADRLTISLFVESDDPLYDDVTYELTFDFAQNTATVNFYSFFGAISAATETDFGGGLEFIAYEDNSDEIDAVVFDLDQYYMELYREEEEYLAPLHLVNLFLSGSVYDVVYNGDRLFGQDTYEFSDSINRFNRSSFNDETMPYDLKLMSYHFTAFVLNHFFGLREDFGINDFYDALEPYQDEWFSDRITRHYRALRDFILSLDDLHTSHTMAGYYNDEPTYGLAITDLGTRGQFFYNTLFYGLQGSYFCDTEDGVEFFENDTVAIIHNASFADNDDISTPEIFKAAIDAIEEKGTVEKIIVNLACNSGGIIGVAWQLMGYMTDEPLDYYSYNAGDGLQRKSTFTSENTTEGTYEWFVLTSPVTFSAANMFANMAKDMGLATIIGAQSSGGAASIKPILLPGGSSMRISSPNILANNVFESTEYGIPVDVEIDIDIITDDSVNIDAVIDATE